ncbi:MAG: DUF2079 domain-containing protein [Candidatus Berkelbacteria bacterium]|nr:DUF2079 domain-containing protein [Candidatus Berkelbacteria bacterium]
MKNWFENFKKLLVALLLEALAIKVVLRYNIATQIHKFHNIWFLLIFILIVVGVWLLTVKVKFSKRSLNWLIAILSASILFQYILSALQIEKIAPHQIPIGKILTLEPWFYIAVSFSLASSYLIVKIVSHLFKKFEKFDFPNCSNWIIFAFSVLLYSVLSVQRHSIFRSFTMDLAGYDQAIYLLSRFQTPVSTIYHFKNLLGDHFEPILAILSPLYRLGFNVKSVLVAQAVFFSLSIFPIYAIAKKYLKSNLSAALISLSLVFFIGVQDALEFDFHPLILAVPALAYAIYFIEENKLWGFLASVLVGFLSKEVFAIYAIFLGIYTIFKKKYWWGIAAIFLGVTWYFLAIKVFIPRLSGGAYLYIGAYHDLGANAGQILKTMITKPIYTLQIFFFPEVKIVSMLAILSSACFLSFFAPSALILILPMFGEKYLSIDRSNAWVMWWHYTVTLAPVLFYSAILGVAKIKEKFSNKKLIILSLSLAIFFSTILTATIYYGKPPYTTPLFKVFTGKFYRVGDHLKNVEISLKKIPQDTCVIAQDQVAPHISARECIYQLKNIDDLSRADYLVFDSAIGHWPYEDDQFADIERPYFNNPAYKIFVQDETLVIFQRVK